jgi:hypothetical protein
MALSPADVLAGLKEIVEEVAGVSAALRLNSTRTSPMISK